MPLPRKRQRAPQPGERTSDVLANELAHQGILVDALDPGWVKTDMGGSAAPLEPERVVDGLYTVIRDLDSSRSGAFINWLGQLVAW